MQHWEPRLHQSGYSHEYGHHHVDRRFGFMTSQMFAAEDQFNTRRARSVFHRLGRP